MVGVGQYILIEKEPVAEPDLIKWGKWFEENSRRVAFTELNGAKVSTVFLALDHNYSDEGPPILFETMVFGGELDDEMERCSTWDEAVAMHYTMVKRVQRSASMWSLFFGACMRAFFKLYNGIKQYKIMRQSAPK